MNVFGNHMLNDLAKVAGGGASLLSGATRSIREEIKSRIEEMAQRLDLVPRDDFDSLRAAHQALLRDFESLKKRVSALEGPKTKSKKKKR